MGKKQLQELEKNGRYFSVPTGTSMWPMLLHKRDIVEVHKPNGEAKRLDVVLYCIGEKGILHRVLRVKEDIYIIVGDNCWRKEYVPKSEVVGIAVRFCRKGRWIEATDRGYRLYAHFWAGTFFLRRPFLYLRDLGKRAIRKMKRILHREQA